MNPVFAFMQKLPTNSWHSVIGGVALLAFGIGGLVTGKGNPMDEWMAISGGIATLGLGSKAEKVASLIQSLSQTPDSQPPQA